MFVLMYRGGLSMHDCLHYHDRVTYDGGKWAKVKMSYAARWRKNPYRIVPVPTQTIKEAHSIVYTLADTNRLSWKIIKRKFDVTPFLLNFSCWNWWLDCGATVGNVFDWSGELSFGRMLSYLESGRRKKPKFNDGTITLLRCGLAKVGRKYDRRLMDKITDTNTEPSTNSEAESDLKPYW